MNKPLVYIVTAVIAALVCLPVLNAKEKKARKPRPKPVTVVGVLAQQDEENEKSPLTLTDAAAEKTYILMLNKKVEGLKELVGKTVKVTGIPGMNKKKAATLRVQKFEEVQQEADEGEGDAGGGGDDLGDEPIEIE